MATSATNSAAQQEHYQQNQVKIPNKMLDAFISQCPTIDELSAARQHTARDAKAELLVVNNVPGWRESSANSVLLPMPDRP